MVHDLLRHTKGELSYQEGVALFASLFPESKVMLRFFQSEDRISRRKLKEELDKAAQFEENKTRNNFQPFAPVKHSRIDPEKLPEDLRKEYMANGARIREMADIHSRLYNTFLTNDQRKEMALRIVYLARERRSAFKRADHYLATGEVIKPFEFAHKRIAPEVPKNFEVEYQLKLLRSHRSRLKSKPARLEEYNQVCEKINELETRRYT